MKRTGGFALVFLLVFCLSTFAMAFHHHTDGIHHPNCPACAAAHFPAAVSGVYALESLLPVAAPEALYVPIRYECLRVAPFLSRAPPA